MSIYRYPPQVLFGDYLRAGAGLLLTLLPLLVLQPSWFVGTALFLVAAVCAYFLFRTAERHRTIIAMDDEGIAVRALKGPKHLAWKDVDEVKLTYYAVRRNKADSWMQLTISAGNDSLKIDSRLEDFLEIVERAAEAARENEVALNRITIANLKALGIEEE